MDSDAATATAAAQDTRALGTAECLAVGCLADTEAVAHIAIGWLQTAACSAVVDTAVVIAADVGGWCGAAQCETIGCSTDTETAVVATGWLLSAGCFASVDSAVVVAADVHV